MSNAVSIGNKRVESIDVLRGLVMVIMAIDHIRDNFHITANLDDPLNLETTSPALFLTRWITHLCAPVFVFLSGTSIYLQSLRKSKNELSLFLLKRGLWLIIAEVLIVSVGITFLPWNLLILQVIWAIGISMVFMAALIRMPFKILLAVGLVIALGHNALDYFEQQEGFEAGVLWEFLHHGHFKYYPLDSSHGILIVYPFLPWLGLMILGYCLGAVYRPEFGETNRNKFLLYTGGGLILLFVILRFINIYGDPYPWVPQENGLHSFFSFIKVHKYPPSLQYSAIFMGIALILLALLENVKNAFTSVMRIFGRTAFFYYIIHWYLVHGLAAIYYFARGGTMDEAIESAKTLPFLFIKSGEGLSLPWVYLIWILVVAGLYPLCKWYDGYKSAHREQWWLSYL